MHHRLPEVQEWLKCKAWNYVIDAGYTGSIRVKLYNLSGKDYKVNAGDKISQLVVLPYVAPSLELVDKLEDTPRGANGFGSTGR